MINVFDIWGVNHEDKGENSIILKPTEHMLGATFPCLKEEGISVTFDRDTMPCARRFALYQLGSPHGRRGDGDDL